MEASSASRATTRWCSRSSTPDASPSTRQRRTRSATSSPASSTGRIPTEADLSIREIKAGDRILLCSDGLSGVVSAETIAASLLANDDPQDAVDELVDLALRGGGPDNITCVVADVVGRRARSTPADAIVVGAVGVQRNSRRLRLPDTPRDAPHSWLVRTRTTTVSPAGVRGCASCC